MTKAFLLSCAAGIVVLTSGVARAQSASDASPPSPSQDDTNPHAKLDEIVVTAQRRAENLTNVPLSIAAVGGEKLAATGVQNISDLKFETPGFMAQAGTGYTQIFIRGIGNSIYVGADPSVATFIDDVPRTYGSLVDNFINVERVEVLKGAQGGLYGRNATGGVINIITRQPGNDPAMNARISAGEHGLVDASAYVNVPITDQVAVNLSATRRIHDPMVRNLATETPYPAGTTSYFGDPNSPVAVPKLNNADFYAVDGKIRANLTDNLKITLSGDYNFKNDGNGNGWYQIDSQYNYLVYLGYAAAAGISNPIAPWPQPGKWEAYASIDSYSRTQDYGGSARVDLSLSGIDISSITALRWNNSNYRGDIGAAPVPMAGFATDFHRNSFYQELRFISNGGGRLQFLGGATYFQDKINSVIDGLFVGFPASENESTIRTYNYSIYGQLSYDITSSLKLTGSLRWIDEVKRGEFPAQSGFDAETARTRQNKLLPSATLSLRVGEGNAYARYARGFKTGGINPLVVPGALEGQPGSTFGGETVDTFEIGYKAPLFDHRVQLTAAVFYNDYQGLQLAAAGNITHPLVTNAILNAGNARTYGAEAAISWRVIPEVTLSVNGGYLNARYRDAGYAGSPVVDPFDISGNRMSLAPEWQAGASVDFDVPMSEKLHLKGNLLYSYVGSYNQGYFENPLMEQPAYSLVNGRIGIATVNDHLGLYVFANNLFNKFYSIYGTQDALGVLLTPGDPRVIGGTMEIKF